MYSHGTQTEDTATRTLLVSPELVDQFVNGRLIAGVVQDAAMAFKKALIEWAIAAEISHHRG